LGGKKRKKLTDGLSYREEPARKKGSKKRSWQIQANPDPLFKKERRKPADLGGKRRGRETLERVEKIRHQESNGLWSKVLLGGKGKKKLIGFEDSGSQPWGRGSWKGGMMRARQEKSKWLLRTLPEKKKARGNAKTWRVTGGKGTKRGWREMKSSRNLESVMDDLTQSSASRGKIRQKSRYQVSKNFKGGESVREELRGLTCFLRVKRAIGQVDYRKGVAEGKGEGLVQRGREGQRPDFTKPNAHRGGGPDQFLGGEDSTLETWKSEKEGKNSKVERKTHPRIKFQKSYLDKTKTKKREMMER